MSLFLNHIKKFNCISIFCRSDGALETGHGVIELAWVKFGEVKNALIEIKDWLNKHPTEIVVPYFGNMQGLDKKIGRLALL